jgi:glycosyltransferase involved in cell wall biosynthesis
VARTTVDVLLVSPGTTAGWRRLDAHAAEALRDSGLTVAIASTDFRIARHLRRTVPLTDLAEAAAMRHAVTRALRRHEPRAILFSAVQSTLLQPRRRLTGAGLRYDALTADNRPGRVNAAQHRLERRALRHLGVLLPAARASRVPAQLRPGQHVVRLPFPVAVRDAIAAEREPLVVCYAGNPDKKGLDVVAQAWEAADSGARRLVVTGVEPERGRRFLRERDVGEPDGLEWAGTLTPQEHAAQVARAAAYVSASRYEDYGIAQLEALASGTPLVTTASAGPYEALALARELEPAFVAEDSSVAALATALRAALEMPAAARADYAERARTLTAPYSEAEVRRRLEQEVIPLLLR